MFQINNLEYKLHYNNFENLKEGVYLLRNLNNDKLKIGTTNNLNNRITEIESKFRFCGIKPKLKIECFIELKDNLNLERFLHNQFKNYNYINEWFDIKDIKLIIDSLKYYKRNNIGYELKRKYKSIWKQMINYAKKHSFIICNEWNEYANFESWIDKIYYTDCGRETLVVNKDILKYDNNRYSPETSLLIPKYLNDLIISDLTLEKSTKGLYRFKCKKYDYNYHKNTINVSIFESNYEYKTEQEAFEKYKKCKNEFIIDLLYLYDDLIPNYIYDLILSRFK